MTSVAFRLGAMVLILGSAVLLLGCEAPLEARQSGTEEVYVETERIPINNCGGPAEVTVHRTVSKTFYREVSVETATETGLDALIVASAIAQEHGHREGEEDQRSFGIDLTAPANSKVVYVLQWKEIWSKGVVYDPNTGQTQGTYRLRKDVWAYVVDSYSEECP